MLKYGLSFRNFWNANVSPIKINTSNNNNTFPGDFFCRVLCEFAVTKIQNSLLANPQGFLRVKHLFFNKLMFYDG